MSQSNQQTWIKKGYQSFALFGPQALKIEVLAREVGKNKSSFYYYFSDLEGFIDELLDHHLNQAEWIGERERQCSAIDPGLIEVLVDCKIDLLFSRQLRVYRQVPKYKRCFEQANQRVQKGFMELWARELGLPYQPQLAQRIFDHAVENFYLQITEQQLNQDWLRGYFMDLKGMVADLIRSNPSVSITQKGGEKDIKP